MPWMDVPRTKKSDGSHRKALSPVSPTGVAARDLWRDAQRMTAQAVPRPRQTVQALIRKDGTVISFLLEGEKFKMRCVKGCYLK